MFLVDINKLLLKCVWKNTGLNIAKTILEKKIKYLPDIKGYYIALATKTAWYWWRYKYISQWKRIDKP